jgi:hypothetical protein
MLNALPWGQTVLLSPSFFSRHYICAEPRDDAHDDYADHAEDYEVAEVRTRRLP